MIVNRPHDQSTKSVHAIHKDTDKAFDNEQILGLSEEELYNMIANRPHIQIRKSMDAIPRYTDKDSDNEVFLGLS